MASLNRVLLIGRLGKDPEITTFENGGKKMSVTLATSERYRDKENNWVDQTDWHNVVAWGNLANDIAEKRRNYIKGDLMYVEGRIKTRQYTDSQGATRYITEIVADRMMQLSSAKGQGSQSSFGQPGEQPFSSPIPTVSIEPTNIGGTSAAPDDDLPF